MQENDEMSQSAIMALPLHAQKKETSVQSIPKLALQRKCSCGGVTKLSGQCDSCKNKELLGHQSKLRIGDANDVYEQEADRVADSVMEMPKRTRNNFGSMSIAKIPKAQRRTTEPIGTESEAPSIVHEAIRSPGQPMENQVRRSMESRFGHDFSQVRIHTDSKANASAATMNSLAYTVGQNIVFGSGAYAPSTHQGGKLLAHELVHTVQQGPAQDSGRVSRKGGTFGGFFRNIGRAIANLFTGSEPDYDHDTLREYLSLLKKTNDIEGDFDSDNKARAVVRRQLRFPIQLADTQIKVLLVEEMLKGPTLGEDEKAIISLLRTSRLEESNRIVSKIGRNRLWDNFSGKNRREIEAISLKEDDFKDDAVVERLKNLTPEKLTEYRDKALDPAVKANVIKILQMQNITTPLDIDVKFDKAGVASFESNGAKVFVKPDIVSNDRKMDDKAHTEIATQGSPVKNIKASGNAITSFDGGETSFVIQTIYGPNASATGPSKYGRGTTQDDQSSGNTTLGFHESQHGRDFLKFITDNTPPKFAGKVGMSVSDFNQAMNDYQNDINDYGKKIFEFSVKKSDCPGTPIERSGLKDLGLSVTFCTTP